MLLGPLTYVGFAGCAILSASLGVSMINGSRLKEDLYRERTEYATRVAAAESERASVESRYRKREQQMAAEINALNAYVANANDKLAAVHARAGRAAKQLLDAER